MVTRDAKTVPAFGVADEKRGRGRRPPRRQDAKKRRGDLGFAWGGVFVAGISVRCRSARAAIRSRFALRDRPRVRLKKGPSCTKTDLRERSHASVWAPAAPEPLLRVLLRTARTPTLFSSPSSWRLGGSILRERSESPRSTQAVNVCARDTGVQRRYFECFSAPPNPNSFSPLPLLGVLASWRFTPQGS